MNMHIVIKATPTNTCSPSMPPPPTLICALAVVDADTIDGMCVCMCGLAYCKVVFYSIGSNAEVIVHSVIEAIS